MKIAIVCSNYLSLDEQAKKGTEIFAHMFIQNLAKFSSNQDLDVTVFAAGNSAVPFKLESVDTQPSIADPRLIAHGKHVIFELALLSKAFAQQDEFDLFHINIGDGDLAVPFAPFVNKPILVTLHHINNEEFTRKFFALFKDYSNVFFVSASEAQRRLLPTLQYAATIYHGIDEQMFTFNPEGGESIMWAGRAIPVKGPDLVVKVATKLTKPTKLFAILKPEFAEWFQESVVNPIESNASGANIILEQDRDRAELVRHFQNSKLFLFPVQYEESFGLVLTEAMACGTPVVAFAQGSIPELIKDGETGFIVNVSDDDVRGDWAVKQTGLAGLCEAVEKIYALSPADYKVMRAKCREHVEANFTIKRMVEEYRAVYKQVASY